MRIVALSDQHGFLPDIPACDLLIVAGDVCPDRFGPFMAVHDPHQQQAWFDSKIRPWMAAAPATPFVAEFLGDAVRVPAGSGVLHHGAPAAAGQGGGGVALVRPHDIEVGAPGSGPGVPATVRRSLSRGAARLLELELDDGTRLEAEVARGGCGNGGHEESLVPGSTVLVRARVAHHFPEG